MPRLRPLPFLLALLLAGPATHVARGGEPAAGDRMAWWREARFGIFIHWGLYAIPAGTWEGRTVGGVGEWIRHIGSIPEAEYDRLLERFDPVAFDAEAWAALFAESGAGYFVITTKHHDGFCLFDSAQGSYDVGATPFGRDIMDELAAAGRRQGLRVGWYHSILDWHHPDYLPKEPYMTPNPGADFERYVAHLHAQVAELLTRYGPIDVMWFDGEWDPTWSHERGRALADAIAAISPATLVNERVDVRRFRDGPPPADGYAGDFGTPEQRIPETGLPGRDWESCITMNETWGFRGDDHAWKSATTLIRMLGETASKGGNLLLNVGPDARGRIPEPSIERLRAIGRWLDAHGEAIRGTAASPFAHLPWGRCTRRDLAGGATRLNLLVFDWPEDGRLVVPGIANDALGARLGRSDGPALAVHREEDALVVAVPAARPDDAVSVVVLDVAGAPRVVAPPRLESAHDVFVDRIEVRATHEAPGAEVRFTRDGRAPTRDDDRAGATITLESSATLAARLFRDGVPISGTTRRRFERVVPWPARAGGPSAPGLRYAYHERDLNSVDEIAGPAPDDVGVVAEPGHALARARRDDRYAFRFHGLIEIPRTGLWTIHVASDDGARVLVDGRLVVDHDGIHAATERSGAAPLAAGRHAIEILFFEKSGDAALDLAVEGPGHPRTALPAAWLRHAIGE